ncbi:Dyp-type peroxidase [Kocuria sp.]|uniref:Dyp-type peroxidase n=1 Tax=Kocuria sp. TaxID=1871328 RepID=UPI0026DFBB94|nr:Dyp-type peroxidase [Kocuria sp.]MDO5617521.1 Dyp-type peroxidase [Kocuria sp.]
MVTQQVVAAPSQASMFLVLTVHEGSEDAIRDFLPGLSDLVKSVSFRTPQDELMCVAGIGASLWSRLFAVPPPTHLTELAPIVGDRHTAVSTPGDLLFHLRAGNLGMCFELSKLVMQRLADHVTVEDEVHGFKFFDERDLLGFVDGTANPEGQAAQDAVVVGAEDPDYAGGSYVIVQKYLHDMGAWDRLSVEEQERVIGRSKLEDVEMPDDVKPTNSHVALNTVTDENGEEQEIFRLNMPFGEVGAQEFGTYFIGYAADPGITEEMLRRMFIGNPAGNHDRILDFSTAVTGSKYFVPSVDLLDDIDSLAAADAGAPAVSQQQVVEDNSVTTADQPSPISDSSGSLGIGSLR